MGKNDFKNLHLDRSKIRDLIVEYCQNNYEDYDIEGPKIINEKTGQNRCSIKTNEIDFQIDFYFRGDNKTTLTPLGTDKEKDYSIKLCQHIKNQCEYDDVPTISFSTIVQKDTVDLLVEYLESLTTVELRRNEEVNNNTGVLYQFISDDGDKITLIYYQSTDKLFYQGKIMKLYIEVKQFLSAFVDIEKIKEQYATKLNIDNESVEGELKKLLSNAYGNIDGVIQEFLYDAIVLSKSEIPVKEYSSHAFPALRALEGYIKKIFGDNGIIISNKYGFGKKVNGKRIPYFNTVSPGKYKLNTGLASINCTTTCTAIEDCYNYYNSKRNPVAHTDYPLQMTTKLPKKEDALDIIYGVIDLIERTYTDLSS